MKNSDFWIRIRSLYGSQTLPVDFECKTACFDPEWLLSIGPSLHLWFCVLKTSTLASELLVSMGPIPHLWFLHATFGSELHVSIGPRLRLLICACKTTWLASEFLVSMGPSLYLWFFHEKQRLFDQNYKSLWVPALICGFEPSQQRHYNQN